MFFRFPLHICVLIDYSKKNEALFFFMKDILVGILFVFVLIFVAVDAGASWLIDEERYHVSVHGRISCLDCHPDIVDKSLHPDPAEVNKTLPDFYRLEQCISCHEDVLEDVSEGTHGGEKITNEQEFNFCIGCHDPHYQLSYIGSATDLDLTRPKAKKCSICHELQKELPPFSPENEQCMNCHRSLPPEAAGMAEYISSLCFHCHTASTISKKPGNIARFDVFAYSCCFLFTDRHCRCRQNKSAQVNLPGSA